MLGRVGKGMTHCVAYSDDRSCFAWKSAINEINSRHLQSKLRSIRIATMAPVLHKVPRHDTESTTDFVLLRADIPALADNLNLQATENENAFFKAFPVATLSKLRAKTFRGSDDEFLRILKGCLLDDYSGGKREEFGEFSMSAAVDGDVLNVCPLILPLKLKAHIYRSLSVKTLMASRPVFAS